MDFISNGGFYESQGPSFYQEDLPAITSLLPQQLQRMENFYLEDSCIDTGVFDLEMIDPSLMHTQNPTLGYPQPSKQQVQQHPMSRFFNEKQRTLFAIPQQLHANHSQRQALTYTSSPINPLPYTTQGRISSPSPSQGLTSCSSALSPPADLDYYSDQAYYSPQIQHAQDDFSAFDHLSQFSPMPVHGSGPKSQTYSLPPFIQDPNCVNLSQVQGVPDFREDKYEANDEYPPTVRDCLIDQNEDHTIHVDTTQHKSHCIDTSLGRSFHDDLTSNYMTASLHNHDQHHEVTDVDLEDEEVEDEDSNADDDGEGDVIVDSPADDTDYTPSSRSRRRKVSTLRSTARSRRQTKPYNALSANIKVSRIRKSSFHTSARTSRPKNGSTLNCADKNCAAGPFSNSTVLAKHVATAHVRPFACVFAYADCAATFGSKNEWKRHVSSQHLNLVAWVCKQGACKNAKGKDGVEFNRKDLFTQHCRRMHVPTAVAKKLKMASQQGKKAPDATFEAHLKVLQAECQVIMREAPKKLVCPVEGCKEVNNVFTGKNPWDERMEHVGKHIERMKKGGAKEKEIHSDKDEYLVQWAEKQGITQRTNTNSWRLCGDHSDNIKASAHDMVEAEELYDDEDAEGDLED